MASLQIVLCVLLYAVDVSSQYNKTESACYGTTGCSWMTLDCQPDGYVFIMKMQYGFKLPNDSCVSTPNCTDCCRPGPLDCFSDYSQQNFTDVYVHGRCWHTKTCRTQVQWTSEGCPQHHKPSSFAVASYVCLKREHITDFNVNTSITAPAVAVHYDRSDRAGYNVTGDNQTWHCQVDTADCVKRQTDVILVKENYTGSSDKCSSVGWSGGPFLPCVRDFQYTRIATFTPFRVSLRVNGNRRSPNGWAVLRAQDGANLIVTCGYTGQALPSPCQVAQTTPSTSQSPTSGGPTLMLTSTKSPWIESEDKASGDELTGVTLPVGVAVAGWAVAVLLVFLLAVLSLLLLRRHGGCQNMIQLFKGKSSPGHLAGSRDQSSKYLHVISDTAAASQGGGPASVYENAGLDRAASERNHVSSDQPRNESNGEYSPLDWSRDQANTYSPLRTT